MDAAEHHDPAERLHDAEVLDHFAVSIKRPIVIVVGRSGALVVRTKRVVMYWTDSRFPGRQFATQPK